MAGSAGSLLIFFAAIAPIVVLKEFAAGTTLASVVAPRLTLALSSVVR